MIEEPSNERILGIELEQEMRQAYLDYAMSVIVARALPDVRDGLKPVQRRILYTMNRAGATAGTKTKKCAAFVGDVMKLYHPHGDAAIYDALAAGDTSAAKLSGFQRRFEGSWIREELWPVRNFHQAFRGGLWSGLFQAGLQMATGGRGLADPIRVKAGHLEYQKLQNSHWKPLERFHGDGKLTFDVLTDLYHSGTRHDDDQPCHLHVLEPDICVNRCVAEYGNPCQYFCPAMVYEMVREDEKLRLKINAANCVHCKTCDIADPYQIINWVPPEGGGGPNYEGM